MQYCITFETEMVTGTGLVIPVWYNLAQIVGTRILAVPVEDVFYGIDLIVLNGMIFEARAQGFFRCKCSERRSTANAT